MICLFSIVLVNFFVCVVVVLLVISVCINLISGSIGIGLKKCRLRICCGCLVVVVIFMIGMLEVFDVSIVFGLVMIWLSLVKILDLMVLFLIMVLIINCLLDRLLRLVVKVNRLRVWLCLCLVILLVLMVCFSDFMMWLCFVVINVLVGLNIVILMLV